MSQIQTPPEQTQNTAERPFGLDPATLRQVGEFNVNGEIRRMTLEEALRRVQKSEAVDKRAAELTEKEKSMSTAIAEKERELSEMKAIADKWTLVRKAISEDDVEAWKKVGPEFGYTPEQIEEYMAGRSEASQRRLQPENKPLREEALPEWLREMKKAADEEGVPLSDFVRGLIRHTRSRNEQAVRDYLRKSLDSDGELGNMMRNETVAQTIFDDAWERVQSGRNEAGEYSPEIIAKAIEKTKRFVNVSRAGIDPRPLAQLPGALPGAAVLDRFHPPKKPNVEEYKKKGAGWMSEFTRDLSNYNVAMREIEALNEAQ